MKNPMISVIIPTYNRVTVITRAIRSVQKQTYQDFEIIVVDDGSTDDTEKVIHSFNESRITYIKHERNLNGAVARNTGINVAKGRYIAFLDSDDEWLPEKLEKQLFKLQLSRNENVLCYSQLYYSNSDTKERTILPLRGMLSGETLDEYLFVNDGVMQTSTLMIPGKLMKKLKFNPNLIRHQDWDLCLQFSQAGVEFIYLDEPLTVWNQERSLNRVSHSNNYKFSLNWINTHRNNITKDTYESFIEKNIVTQLSFEGELSKKTEMLEELLALKNSILIYGAGETTKSILGNLDVMQKKKIIGLIDQSTEKQGQYLEDIQICSPLEISNLDFEILVISVQKYKLSKSIFKDMLKLNKKIVNLSEYFIKF